MKLTKATAKKMLRGDYMDALAYFANLCGDTDGADLYNTVQSLDDIVWEWASEWGGVYEENWLRIFSALLCAC